MNRQQIKDHLRVVTDRVLACVEASKRELIGSKIYVAGGAIANLVLDEQPVDYDFFCEDEETASYFKTVAQTNPGFVYQAELLSRTENAVTWKLKTGEVVQVITRFVGPPERVFTSFDYEHCKTFYSRGYYSHTLQIEAPDTLHYDEDLLLSKKLVYTGEKDQYCLNTLKRAVKFVSRGWTPDNTTIINLYLAIQKSPSLADPVEYQKQTIGFYGSSFK